MLNDRTLPDPLRVVIAGGGVAALEALAALGAVVPRRVTPVLITKTINFRYRPQLIGEPFGHGAPRAYPLDRIAADHGAELIADDVVEVMPDMHTVRTASDALVRYDVLIIATGARAYPAFQDGITFDRETSPDDFDDALADLGAGLAPHVAIVVPDGVTWTLPAYQLALATAAWGRAHHNPTASVVTLLTPERRPLEAFGATVALEVADLLESERIVVRTDVHPDVVTATSLRAGGQWLGADRIVALPVLQGPRLPGLPHDARGFLDTSDVPDVHVVGDASHDAPIKQGGLAAQQADAVVQRIAEACGAPPPAHGPEPVILRGLLDTRHGPRFLRADLADPDGTSTFSDTALWWPPTAVATRRLAPYLASFDLVAGAAHA
jgi:sulfide:quinone oxidoreductase